MDSRARVVGRTRLVSSPEGRLAGLVVLAAASQSLWWTSGLIGFITGIRRHG